MLPRPDERRELRSFAFTLGGALLAIAAWQQWRDRPRVALALLVPALLLVAFGMVAPRALRTVRAAWMALAHAMSRVTTPVILGIVYFGVLTPLGLARRLLVRRGRSPDRKTSCWVERPAGERRSDLQRQF